MVLHRAKHFFDGQEHYEDYEMLVDQGKIIAVGKKGSLSVDSSTEIRDHGDRFIMPGIIDCHIHFFSDAEVATFGDYFKKHSDGKKMCLAVYQADEALRLGITSARDVASPGTYVCRASR